MRHAGILLCGCGVYDGTDVQEAVLAAAALEARGFRCVFIAPSGAQADVVDHATGMAVEGAPPRDILTEAARVARGAVRALDELLPGELDALVIPGGVGVVRNLCAAAGEALGGGALRPDVVALLDELKRRGAPVAAIGLGSVVLRRHAGQALASDLLGMTPGAILREEGGRILITAGFLGTNSIAEVAATLALLAEAVAARCGAARLLQLDEEKKRPS